MFESRISAGATEKLTWIRVDSLRAIRSRKPGPKSKHRRKEARRIVVRTQEAQKYGKTKDYFVVSESLEGIREIGFVAT